MSETFFGHDIDADTAEVLFHSRWADKDRRKELDLFGKKDWDERARHPVVSTYRFCHLFTHETRDIIRKHIDNSPPRVTNTGKVVDWNPIKGGDPLEPPASAPQQVKWKRKIGSVIRARQWCDEHGIPYEFAIRTSLRRIYFGRNYLLQRTTLPDPGLLNGEELREQVLIGWADQVEARIQHGTHSRYLLRNADPHPDVRKHQVWLFSQIKRRGHPHHALAKFIKMDMICPRAAALAFPRDISRALALIA